MTTSELTVRPDAKLALPASYKEIFDLAEKVAGSQFIPTQFKNKPGDIAVAMMMATENGVNPIQALGFIAVINGKPGWHSDAVPGIAKAKGLISGYQERYEGEFGQDNFKAICTVTASDGSTYTNEFSIGDAKLANLWGKSGPWKNYPKRMLQWRARNYAIRDAAPDAFFGPSAEELSDVNAQHRGPDRAKTINVDEGAKSRDIVTMALPVDEDDSSVGQITETEIVDADEVRSVDPDQIDKPEDNKKTIKDVIMELADADDISVVRAVEDQMDGKRAQMSERHLDALQRAIDEAKSRLSEAV